uniref:Death domain-containing protein n=1 Tax=Daphnia galeata TaxID=27404 RepID=A0A8J2RCS9_9CRUS|nr:unnamed protein product [Daphnia galeata]
MRNPALDQELEDIRKTDVPGPPDLTKCLIDWLTKSANYSIKKFTSDNQIGWDILHVIARFIDGTPVGSNGDWKHLAGLLGLHIHDIIRIENFSTIKGATLEVLSQFALNNHATVSKLLEALSIMERHDILYAISEKLEALLNPFATSIQEKVPLNSYATSNQPNELDNEMDSGMAFSISGEADPENLKSVTLGSSPSLPIENNFQKESEKKKMKYSKTVLLTFTQDGYEIAQQVARQIRSLNLGFGVLILEENRDELEFCGEKVDYIIPIITEEYLWQSWNDGWKWSLWCLRGKNYVPVNQVVDFRANEVEKQVSESICLIAHI